MKRKPSQPSEPALPAIPFDDALRRMLATPPDHKKAAKKSDRARKRR
jgi:hypothetical protein